MAYQVYCVFFFALVIMSLCVWLTVASVFVAHSETLNSVESEGELIFAHVVRNFLFFK